MSTEPTDRPYLDPEPDGYGGAPHLHDYWQVISRRLWLVLVIFTVTTASSIWAISRQTTFYTSSISLQINDPQERQAGLVNVPRMGGVNLFVDPIQSEIQVLSSASIRRVVVDSLGMRLTRFGAGLRSDLVRNILVAEDAPNGLYRIVYGQNGDRAQFMMADGTIIGEAEAGRELDAGFVSFVLQALPADEEDRSFDMEIVPSASVIGEISMSAAPRVETNIVDVSLIHEDPVLVPQILNQAGLALRDYGAERVRQQARQDAGFIEAQLDTALQKLRDSQEAIRQFKATEAFTSLTAQERDLVSQGERITSETQGWEQQRQVLSALVRSIQEGGIDAAGLTATLSELPPGTSAQVRTGIQSLQAKQAEERSLIQEERLAEGHARVMAVQGERAELEDQLTEAANASLGVVQERLAQLSSEDQDLRVQQARFPELEGTLENLEAQRRLDADSYQFIQSQLYQAQIGERAAAPYVEILDESTYAFPISGRGTVNVFLGALLGLILGVGAAFFLEYLDRTVRTSSDVESLLGIPVLGVIPRLRRLDGVSDEANAMQGKGLPLVVAMDPLDPAAEAYRNLRMNLMFMSTTDEPIRTILFSSPGPSEGKSTTAVNFAVMLAQQGQRVLMIDADLRRPSLHRALDVLREPGLTNLLIGDAEPRETVRPNVLPNLDFLPSGPFPPNPSELLNSSTMVRILEEFEGRYDQIIIDSPPVLAVTDAAILAVHTDGAVIVLRSGETEQRAAERSVDQLRRLGVRVFGAVLNEVTAANPDESYYLQYYYSYTPAGTAQTTSWQRLREGMSKVKFFG